MNNSRAGRQVRKSQPTRDYHCAMTIEEVVSPETLGKLLVEPEALVTHNGQQGHFRPTDERRVAREMERNYMDNIKVMTGREGEKAAAERSAKKAAKAGQEKKPIAARRKTPASAPAKKQSPTRKSDSRVASPLQTKQSRRPESSTSLLRDVARWDPDKAFQNATSSSGQGSQSNLATCNTSSPATDNTSSPATNSTSGRDTPRRVSRELVVARLGPIRKGTDERKIAENLEKHSAKGKEREVDNDFSVPNANMNLSHGNRDPMIDGSEEMEDDSPEPQLAAVTPDLIEFFEDTTLTDDSNDSNEELYCFSKYVD